MHFTLPHGLTDDDQDENPQALRTDFGGEPSTTASASHFRRGFR
jgi:hypothetical protein